MTIALPSWIDIAALTIAIIFVLFSLKNGLLRSLLDVAAMVFSLYLAHLSYDWVSASVPILSQNALAYAVLIFSSWFFSFIVLEMILGVLLKLASLNFAPPADKVGSLLIGIVKVLILGGLIFRLLLLLPLPESANKEIDNTYSRKWFGNVFDWSYQQAEKIAKIKKYQFDAGSFSVKSKKQDLLIQDSQLKELEKALSKDIKLQDLKLPQLQLDSSSRKSR
jgi:uncharacterized membrane protein required for colicin V production